MQAMLAQLAVGLSVKDSAYKAGMAAARADARRTGQDMERESARMSGAFEDAARTINKVMVGIGQGIAGAAASATRGATALTIGVTVPLTLAGSAARGAAADFETGMNRVRSAMVSADPEQIDALRDAALRLGPAMGRSAGEAAEAIESLAKGGMSAAAVLDGGLVASLRLATVGSADLGAAADLTTSITAQFGKRADELPDVVNKVAGALDAATIDFDDYRLALGQAGGVAGGLGVSFEDLNIALTATASTFASGSDAGTSFKTFLTSLNPVSKEAARTMQALGLQFFDATGRAKPLAEVAQVLRDRLGNLNDQSRREALSTIFGSDGMRTAIALMNQGADGIERTRQAIDAISADDKLAVLMEGDAAASARLSSALDVLAIRFGEVLLPVTERVKSAMAAMVTAFADVPYWFRVATVSAAALAAAMGPVAFAVLGLAKLALPLLLLRLGPVAMGFAAILNPLGFLIRLLGSLMVSMAATAAMAALGARLVGLAGPIGLVITALTIVVPLMLRTAQASDAMREAQDRATKAHDAAVEETQRLATATGVLREELMRKARADAAAAVAAVRTAKADMIAARAALARAKAQEDAARAGPAAMAVNPFAALAARVAGGNPRAQAEANLRATSDTLATALKTFDVRMGALQMGAPTGPESFAIPEEARKARARRDRSAQEAQRYADELGALRVARTEADADLTGAIEARYRATMAGIAEERASYARQVAVDDSLTAAKRAALIAAKDEVLDRREQLADQTRFREGARAAFDLDAAINDARQEAVRSDLAMAETMRERRAGELRLLELQRQQEAAQLDLILATEDTSSAAWSNAKARRDGLAAIYDRRARIVERDTEGPAESYMRALRTSADGLAESIEGSAISAMARLNDELADAVMGAGNLAQAFTGMASSIVRDLLRIAVQRQVIAPLAERLFGASGGAGLLSGLVGARVDTAGLASGAASALAGLRLPAFAGGKASGGRVGPGNWYMVGERGREAFVPDTAGTIVPNEGLRKLGGGPTQIFDLRGALTTESVIRQANEKAAQTAGKVITDYATSQSRAARRRL